MIDHADKLRELIPNGDGHYSEYAGILADAADHVEALQRENADLVALVEDMLPYVKNCERVYTNDWRLRPYATVANTIIDRAKAVTGGREGT